MLIRVHGMRRSGNHAVIAWLRRNLPGETVFLNDCRPGDPYATFQSMETPRGDRHGPSFRDTRWFPQFEAHRGRFHHVVSHEDQAPGPEPLGFEGPWRTVVVHRGFLGWLASYHALVVGRQGGTAWGVDHPSEIVPMIGVYADLLRAPCCAAVSLERWAAEPAHRRGVLAALGLEPLDDDTGPQTDHGGGSSVEPGAEPPDARALADRGHALAHDPGFEALVLTAARDDAFIAALERLYPDQAKRLARLAAGERLRADA